MYVKLPYKVLLNKNTCRVIIHDRAATNQAFYHKKIYCEKIAGIPNPN